MDWYQIRMGWETIKEHLEAAIECLPSVDKRTSDRYQRLLAHDALETAFHEMVMSSSTAKCGQAFWNELALAAQHMGMNTEAAQCARHVERCRRAALAPKGQPVARPSRIPVRETAEARLVPA